MAGAALGLAGWLGSARGLQPWDLPIAAGALAAGLLLARVVPGARLPQIGGWPVLFGFAVLPVLLAAALLPVPVSNDETAYLAQAEIFAAGALAEPLPLPACAADPRDPAHAVGICPLHRRQMYEDPERGRRFAKYPAGTAAALAPGAAVGLPQAMLVLAGLLDFLLMGALAARLGLPAPGRAVLLLAVAPTFLLVQGSVQSEVFGLPAALAGALCLMRARGGGERAAAWGLGIGAAAGWVFLVRPLTGVLFAVACLPGLLRRGSSASPAPGWRALLAAVGGGLPFLALALVYQHAQTGSWFTAPYELYANRFGPFDAGGQPVDVYGRGDLLHGLLEQFGRASIGLGGVLGAFGLGLWGLWRLRARDGGSMLAFALLLPGAYALHWYPGHWGYAGSLYAYESLGFLVLGLVGLLGEFSAPWRRGLVLAACVGALALVPYRYALLRKQSLLRATPARAAAAAPAGAVVLLPFDGGSHLKDWQPSRPPFGPDQTVLVQELPDVADTRAALEQLGLAVRPVYRLRSVRDAAVPALEPWP